MNLTERWTCVFKILRGACIAMCCPVWYMNHHVQPKVIHERMFVRKFVISAQVKVREKRVIGKIKSVRENIN